MDAILPRTRATGVKLPRADSVFWPAAALALMALLHFALALFRAVNWDEFFHFSQIHQFAAGGPIQPLQTLHVRLFAWAVDLPGGAIEQLRAVRVAMFGFVMATATAIYFLSLRFAARSTALVCALLYLSAGFVLQHGTSLRADAIIAALLTISLAILARAPLRWTTVLAMGALCALAALESIKVVLFAPAFLGLAWMRWEESGFSGKALLRLCATGAACAAFFALFYMLHTAPPAPAAGSGTGGGAVAAGIVRSSGQKMFAIGGLPYYHFILKAALLALVFAALVVWTPVLIARGHGGTRAERVALAGLWLPITVVAFYHNSAPYFYVFILAPVAAACAPAARALIDRYSLAAVCGILVVGALALMGIEDRRAQANQRAIIAAAETMFPRAVAYFDFPAMLGSWPKANHFMTPWGQDAYLARQAPSFRETMEHRPVPLVIENSREWEVLFRTRAQAPAFLPEDAEALRENYIRAWGPLMVAGRTARAGDPERGSEFLVPGVYTVRDAPVRFDGIRYDPGETLAVSRGMHRYRAAAAKDATILWGDHLQLPSDAPPTTPFWADF